MDCLRSRSRWVCSTKFNCTRFFQVTLDLLGIYLRPHVATTTTASPPRPPWEVTSCRLENFSTIDKTLSYSVIADTLAIGDRWTQLTLVYSIAPVCHSTSRAVQLSLPLLSLIELFHRGSSFLPGKWHPFAAHLSNNWWIKCRMIIKIIRMLHSSLNLCCLSFTHLHSSHHPADLADDDLSCNRLSLFRKLCSQEKIQILRHVFLSILKERERVS